jgi:hypothetical protein
MNLSGDYDAKTLKEQKAFLRELGPYHSLVATDSKDLSLMHLKRLWFTHWPLKLAQYINIHSMHHHENQIWMVSIPSLSGFFSHLT